jgi:hypothetical protein
MTFDIAKYTADFFKLPSPPLQKRWAQEWERVTVHTRGKHPKKLIDVRRPYEPEEVRKFRKDNYVAFTMDPFNRAITNLQRIFSKASVTFHGPDELLECMEQPVFRDLTMPAYFSRFVTRRMIEDANGFLVWWVADIPEMNIQAAPEPHLVLSKNAKHVTKDVFSWKSAEKSPVDVPDPAGNNKRITADEGDVYYIVSKEAYYKLQQYGPIEKRLFELVPHYAHALGYLPVFTLGGEETGETDVKTNEELCWLTSYFTPAVAFADECVRQVSDHQGVMVTSTSPIREVDAPTCTVCMGKKVTVKHIPADGGHMPRTIEEECDNCGGKGRIIPSGPFGILYREETTMMNEGKGREIPAMRFISPDVNIVKYSGEYWMILLDKVNRSLNLLFVEQAQSGTAKEKDREDEVAMLDRMAEHYYEDIFRNSMLVIADLRQIAYKPEEVFVSLPPTFVVKTEADLLTELETINKSGVNALFRIEAAKEHVKKRFPGNMKVHKMVGVLAVYDPLFGYSPTERLGMEAKGGIDPETLRRSIYGPMAIQRLIEEDGEQALDQEYAQIEERLDDIINEVIQEPEPEPDPLVPVGEDGRPTMMQLPLKKKKGGKPEEK